MWVLRDEEGGLGMSFVVRAALHGALITECHPERAAARALLRAGQVVHEVNGMDVAHMSGDEVTRLLRGAAWSRVCLTVSERVSVASVDAPPER